MNRNSCPLVVIKTPISNAQNMRFLLYQRLTYHLRPERYWQGAPASVRKVPLLENQPLTPMEGAP